MKINFLCKAPIDNKNVFEDWDFLSDSGENTIETSRLNKKKVIYFVNNGCLWKNEYFFGDNTFVISCLDISDENHLRMSFHDIVDKLNGISCVGNDLIADIVAMESEHIIKVNLYFKIG